MAEAFVELGAEGVNYLTENHWDKIHDPIAAKFQRSPKQTTRTTETRERVVTDPPPPPPDPAPQSAVSGRSRRKQRNRLPSPEGSIQSWDRQTYRETIREEPRSPSLDRESLRSEQVIRAYEADPRDPPARPEEVLPKKDLKKLRRDSRMSYGNNGGYAGSNLAPGGYERSRQSQSQQPPRSRYYDEDEESDYDERTGQRYRSSGRGYDDRYNDDDNYREVVTTERYKGPARGSVDNRRESYGTRGYNDGPYGAGAVTQYNRRSTTEVDQDYRSRRSQSRGRRDRDRDSRSRSRSGGSRSRSRSREHSGIRGKIDDTFDTSMQGLGVGLAGAVVGGLAGREFGHRHKNRDILIGALVGGLGANAAENKWRDWKDDKKRDLERDEDRLEQKWDGRGDYGRSRSSMR